ncbi:MAG: ATP-binding protein [bacterium]
MEKKYPSNQDAVVKAERLAERFTEHLDFDEDQRVDVAIAITEAVNNAVEHGNRLEADRTVTVRLEWRDSELVITVRDQGRGFDLDSVDDPLSPENLTKPDGRGLLIVRSLMDSVEVNPSSEGTEVVMVKKR